MNIPPLNTIVFEITNKCNERCVHCYLPTFSHKKGNDFSYNDVCKIIDEFKELGGENVVFTGGEAILHEDLNNAIQYAKSKELWVALYSNFTLISDYQLEFLKSIGIDDVQVSIYGVTPEIHDAITGVIGSCVKTKRNIEKAIEIGLPLRLTCSLLKENCTDACNLLAYANMLKVQLSFELNIIANIEKHGANLDHRLNIIELERVLCELKAFDREFVRNMLRKRNIKFENNQEYEDFLNSNICGASRDMLYISSSGLLNICPGWIVDGTKYENGMSIKDFWENNKTLNNIREIKESDFPQCLQCEAIEYCVRCFARNLSETGNYMKPPKYACNYAFMAKKIAESK